MKCYDCGVSGQTEEAVGICLICGRGVCRDHSILQHLPQTCRTSTGPGTQVVRCPTDRLRLVCRECDVASKPTRGERVCCP